MTQLVILAAGNGTRFGNISTHTHKCLLPYQGKPIVSHIMDKFYLDNLLKNKNEVIIAANSKYSSQLRCNAYTQLCDISTIYSDSFVGTLLKVRNKLQESFFLSVSDCIPFRLSREHKFGDTRDRTTYGNIFYTKEIKDSTKYNTVELDYGRINKLHHFEKNGIELGLTGHFYIKDSFEFLYWCKTAVDKGLKDREANNFVFDNFIKDVKVSTETIDSIEFNTLEDYLAYAEA